MAFIRGVLTVLLFFVSLFALAVALIDIVGAIAEALF